MQNLSQKSDGRLVLTLPNGAEHVFWDPFPKQLEFHQSEVRNFLARGSRGSGKSELLRNDAHMRLLSVPGSAAVLVRNTLKQLNLSHLRFIRKEMQLLGGSYHGTNYCAVYPNGSQLFFTYVGNEGDSLNLLSAELIAGYFDELSLIPWDDFQKLQSSIRIKKGLGIKGVTRSATNPFGPSAAEVEKYFVHKDVDYTEDPDYRPDEFGYIQINMEDNPHIDIEDYKRGLSALPPHLRKAWLHGEYSDENALFDFNARHKETGKPYHVIDEIDLPKIIAASRIYRVFDMGWHPDPAYCAWIAHLGNRYIVFHEVVRYKTIISDWAEIIKSEDEKLGIRSFSETGPTKKVAATFCDPSMDIHTGAEIRTNRGIFEAHDIPMECSVNNRELFASMVHQALAEEAEPGIPRLQIYRGTKQIGAPYMARALPLQRFNPKRPMAMDDHPHDHPVVALAYFLISHASNERREASDLILPKWMQPKRGPRQFTLGDEAVRNRY